MEWKKRELREIRYEYIDVNVWAVVIKREYGDKKVIWHVVAWLDHKYNDLGFVSTVEEGKAEIERRLERWNKKE